MLKRLSTSLVLYLDSAITILNKPSGVVSQSAAAKDGVVPALPQLLQDIKQEFNLPCDPQAVHRLDKTTTGVLLLANSPNHLSELNRQFKNRTVGKTYLALIRGIPNAAHGEIRLPLTIDDGWVSSQAGPNSVSAHTEWECLSSSSNCALSLLRIKIKTGRKHQIRVHMASGLGYPILGDHLYTRNTPSYDSLDFWFENFSELPAGRIFLHASELSIFRYKKHGHKKRVRLTAAAPIPQDFLDVCVDAKISTDMLDAHIVNGGLLLDNKLISDPEVLELAGRWMGPPLQES